VNFSFAVHNFFNPQPTKGAGLYLLRSIIHDWPDQDAKIILKRLRDAANPSSKLIIFDLLAVHTCEASSVTLASGNKVPYPLLPCLGIAGVSFVTLLDIKVRCGPDDVEQTDSFSDAKHSQRQRAHGTGLPRTRRGDWMEARVGH
jgi:O-methyltransferase domain